MCLMGCSTADPEQRCLSRTFFFVLTTVHTLTSEQGKLVIKPANGGWVDAVVNRQQIDSIRDSRLFCARVDSGDRANGAHRVSRSETAMSC